VFYRNSKLARSKLSNHRLSAKVVMVMQMLLARSATTGSVARFRQALKSFLKANPAKYLPLPDNSIAHAAHSEVDGVVLDVRITLRNCSWQQRAVWRERRQELFLVMQQLIDELGIAGHMLMTPALIEMVGKSERAGDYRESYFNVAAEGASSDSSSHGASHRMSSKPSMMSRVSTDKEHR